MKVTCAPFDLTQLALSPEQAAARTEGVHVSTIIRKLSAALAPPKNEFTEEHLDRFAVLGRLWEVQLSQALFPSPRYERPGEVEKDQIIGSPDCVDTQDWAVTEFKCCWKSNRDFEGTMKWKTYLWQVKSYCVILNMVRAKLIVLFINGDYNPPCPIALQWSLLFAPQELAEHWRMMLVNRD